MKLSREEISHIANLARLELSEAEMEKYGQQLSGVLSYVEQLSEVDTDAAEPTAQVTGLQDVFREDIVRDWPADEVESALMGAPELEERQYKVKRVL